MLITGIAVAMGPIFIFMVMLGALGHIAETFAETATKTNNKEIVNKCRS